MPTSDEYRPIRRCVCAGVTFETLKEQGVQSLEQAAEYDCGINCGRCRPYIQQMIETGETAFSAD
jgi:bacterioferritin-associated ferredoxin